MNGESTRDITAWEMYNELKDRGIETDAIPLFAIITALSIRHFFPLLLANAKPSDNDFETLAKTMATTISIERIIEFTTKIIDKVGVSNSLSIGSILVDTLLSQEITNKNNKEVN